MQLDKTRIVVRERNFTELLDLALQVTRAHVGPIALCLLVGALPMCLANYYFLSDADLEDPVEPVEAFAYIWVIAVLMLLEVPLATAPITLYLGQVMFDQQFSLRKLVGDLVRSLPQLLLLQGLIRMLLFPLLATLVVPYVLWAYLTEVILLERNPLWGKRRTGVTTLRRAQHLHGPNTGEIFFRALVMLGVGSLLTVLTGSVLWSLRALFLGSTDYDDRFAVTVVFPVAFWIVLGYLAVVRFLSYLDLRIRTEGWEIELHMRAEAARLENHFA